jgi:glycerol-1-phosphate dehydrogenase [NAD(P)+]
LYEFLYTQPFEQVDPVRLASLYPDEAVFSDSIDRLFDIPELRAKAHEETRAKAITGEQLLAQLARLREIWPSLRQKLLDHLLPSTQIKQMLRDAGAAYESEQIGISPQRLAISFAQAYFIRRRFTVLDLAARTGTLGAALDHLFA